MGAVITNGYDPLLRRDSFSATTGGPDFEVAYTYGVASRLETVVSGLDTSTYAYVTDSGLIESVTSSRNGTTSLAATNAYDNLERLTSTSASNGSIVVSSHGHTHNDLNQRQESVLEDGGKWTYQYDDMGQVFAGNKTWPGNEPVAGSQFGYAFDGIGNRISATVNGRVGSYTPNSANQYTEREVPDLNRTSQNQ